MMARTGNVSLAPLFLILAQGAFAVDAGFHNGFLPLGSCTELTSSGPSMAGMESAPASRRLASNVIPLPDGHGRKVVLQALALTGTIWIQTAEHHIPIVVPNNSCDGTAPPNGLYLSKDRSDRALAVVGCFDRVSRFLSITIWDGGEFTGILEKQLAPTGATVSDQGSGTFKITVFCDSHGRPDAPDVYLVDGKEIALANHRFPELYQPYVDRVVSPDDPNIQWRFRMQAAAVKALAYQRNLPAALSVAEKYQEWLDEELARNRFEERAVQWHGPALSAILRARAFAELYHGNVDEAKRHYLASAIARRRGHRFPGYWIDHANRLPNDERVRLLVDSNARFKWQTELWKQYNTIPHTQEDEAQAAEAMGDDLWNLLRFDDSAQAYRRALDQAGGGPLAERLRRKLTSVLDPLERRILRDPIFWLRRESRP